MTSTQTTNALRIISAGMLVLALLSLPYSYYTLLRFVVCITAILSAFDARDRKDYWLVIFIIIGVLFNPIMPIYLNRSIWQATDIIVAGILVFYKSARS